LSEGEGPGLAVTIHDLVRTFETVLARVKTRPIYEVGRDDVSVPEMIQYLQDQLGRARGSKGLSATRLFEELRSQRAIICLFLAILELVKRRDVELVQGEAFGDIGLRRGPEFRAAGESAESYAEVEQEYR
jgi:segregation and condensation protein A